MYVAHMGKMRNTSRILVTKPERKRWFWRTRYRREGNIKMDLKKIRENMAWIHVVQLQALVQ
jgi:hypothetical protein